jgi:hypothetical protein
MVKGSDLNAIIKRSRATFSVSTLASSRKTKWFNQLRDILREGFNRLTRTIYA